MQPENQILAIEFEVFSNKPGMERKPTQKRFDHEDAVFETALNDAKTAFNQFLHQLANDQHVALASATVTLPQSSYKLPIPNYARSPNIRSFGDLIEIIVDEFYIRDNVPITEAGDDQLLLLAKRIGRLNLPDDAESPAATLH